MHCCNKIKHLVKKRSYRDENTAKYQYLNIYWVLIIVASSN
jgi:hypothetical protein